MKTIKIKQMKLLNFKGIRNLQIDFTDITNIYGANAAGKTTIADAFMWLLFNKDTKGRADFNVKTLDTNNKVIPEIEHSVEATIEIDGMETVITKTMSDNWVKRRGSTEKEFKGNTTEYYVNDVPKKQKEFQEFVADLVNEDVFRMLTSPLHFNKMAWKERRDIILQMVPQPTDIQILEIEPDVEVIIEMLETKTTDDIKAELDARKRKLAKDLVDLPGRIDEAKRNLYENPVIDEEMLNVKKGQKLTLEERLSSSSQILEEVKNKQSMLHQLVQAKQNSKMEFEVRQNELRNAFNAEQDKEPLKLQQQISALRNDISLKRTLIVDVEQYKMQENIMKQELTKLSKDYTATVKKEFALNENETVCPTCQRKLDNALLIIADLEAKFLEQKNTEIQTIDSYGHTKKQQLEQLSKQIDDTNNSNAALAIEINELESKQKELLERQNKLLLAKETFIEESYVADAAAEEEIKKLTAELANVSTWNDAQKTIQRDIEMLNAEIDREYMRVENELKQNVQTEARITELKDSERTVNVQIAKTEQLQDLLTTYIITRVNLIETEVNNKFQLARFKMFEEQINGGIKETCEVTVDGVPYSDLNNAMTINVGLDVINALNNHFAVVAPIFVDNRESVTTLIDTQAQVINLIVSENDKELRIA